MNTTLTMSMTNGTLHLQDGMKLEFYKGEITITGKEKIEYALAPVSIATGKLKEHNNKVASQFIKQAPKPKKQASSKTEKASKSIKTDPVKRVKNIDRQRLLKLLRENGPLSVKQLVDLSGEKIMDIKNFFYDYKKKGELTNIDRGVYDVMSRVNKGGKRVPVPAKEIKQEIKFDHVDAHGDGLVKGDGVILKHKLSHVDDILIFPLEHNEEKAFIKDWDQGSSMIKVILNTSGKEILVYPHWLIKIEA